MAHPLPDSRAAAAALVARGWRIAVAESCTGGLLSAALTAVPGASRYVRGGVVAYDNEVKAAMLDVDPRLITTHGAVSAEVAEAMAAGAATRLDAEVGVGITGVAGPGAEEGGKPAGLVFVALVSPRGRTVRRLDGDHGREENRAGAVVEALRLVAGLA